MVNVWMDQCWSNDHTPSYECSGTFLSEPQLSNQRRLKTPICPLHPWLASYYLIREKKSVLAKRLWISWFLRLSFVGALEIMSLRLRWSRCQTDIIGERLHLAFGEFSRLPIDLELRTSCDGGMLVDVPWHELRDSVEKFLDAERSRPTESVDWLNDLAKEIDTLLYLL